MEKNVKDRLEKPSKMHMSIHETDNGGFVITHNPKASLSFQEEPSEETHHSFSAGDGRAVMKHLKKYLNLGGQGTKGEGPVSDKSLEDGKSEREVESKGESVGLYKGKAGYKAGGSRGGY